MHITLESPLAHRLAKYGYILFGGDNGDNSNVNYVIAVLFSNVVIKP